MSMVFFPGVAETICSSRLPCGRRSKGESCAYLRCHAPYGAKCCERHAEDEADAPRLYAKYEGERVIAYAYGEPWVQQALLMDDIGFATPYEAKVAWEEGRV